MFLELWCCECKEWLDKSSEAAGPPDPYPTWKLSTLPGVSHASPQPCSSWFFPQLIHCLFHVLHHRPHKKSCSEVMFPPYVQGILMLCSDKSTSLLPKITTAVERTKDWGGWRDESDGAHALLWLIEKLVLLWMHLLTVRRQWLHFWFVQTESRSWTSWARAHSQKEEAVMFKLFLWPEFLATQQSSFLAER